MMGMFALGGLWTGCANIMAPTGGPRDEKAPELRRRTLQDSALNFRGGKITFEFNEFVRLQDVQNQLIISPFLKQTPKLSAHKRKVYLHLPDSLLRPNTTYQISLGKAVQDIHESNALPNLSFTFSTGSYFDSLSVVGRCIDASTGLPDTAMTALLYPSGLSDSALMKEKPLYAQKAREGNFRIEHLPAGSFTLYGLSDKNGNFRYDGPPEKIAFLKGNVQAGDTTPQTLFSFTEAAETDTAKQAPKRTPGRQGNKTVDALAFTLSADTANRERRSVELGEALKIRFNAPMREPDAGKVRLFQGEVFDAQASCRRDTDRTVLLVHTDWQSDALYTLQLLRGYAQDSNGRPAPADTFQFRTKRLSDYGTLRIRTTADPKALLQVIKGEQVLRQVPLSDTVLQVSLLPPGIYSVRILHDENGNGRWDTGRLYGKRVEPELTEQLPGDVTVRANWEVVLDLRKKR